MMDLQARFPNERLSLVLDVSDALVLMDRVMLGETISRGVTGPQSALAALASVNTTQLVPDAHARALRIHSALVAWLNDCRKQPDPAHLELVTHEENMRRSERRTTRPEMDVRWRQRKKKDHCKRGHLLTPKNTYPNRWPHRHCKLCYRIRAKQQRQRRDQLARTQRSA